MPLFHRFSVISERNSAQIEHFCALFEHFQTTEKDLTAEDAEDRRVHETADERR
jgi:hypothetical protein